MPKSSSQFLTITPMNPIKTHPLSLSQDSASALGNPAATGVADDDDAEDIFHSYHLHPQSLLLDDDDDDTEHEIPAGNLENHSPAQTLGDPHPQSPFSSFLLRYPDAEYEEEEEDELPTTAASVEDAEQQADIERKPELKSSSESCLSGSTAPGLLHVDPSPHISSQFYTFNRDSHSLMARCILEGRLALPEEIRQATPQPVLTSWRLVWKDRNEDTAYLTAWKRIQDKLQAHVDVHGNQSLFFKNNPTVCVSHVEQWQGIVSSSHADPDLLRHLGLKDTVDRIKQSWTVGAKFYGIPESFIRDCISSCHVCSSPTTITGVPTCGGGSAASRSKRRRFEYTESLEVPASDVPRRLQQLAAKHKVVLCIRQKYIRYKPFMAEVKDYACHRAGEPSSASTSASTKKQKVLKREPYQSKRCGCGFRIRAIMPIANYNEKDKTFVYLEEGTAVFKLYAVHSGHEPGPLDGNARIIHRVVGHKGGFEFDPVVYGVQEETEPESFVGLMSKNDGCSHHRPVLQQVQELRVEAGLLEGKMAKMPLVLLNSLSQELSDILNRLRNFTGQQISEETLVMDNDGAVEWGCEQPHNLDEHDRIFGNKDGDTIEEDEPDFDSTLGDIGPWGNMVVECEDRKMLMSGSLKSDKWLLKEDCSDFDEKSILNCVEDEDSKLIKPLRHDGTIVTDSNLVGMQVDVFYPENTKWYDSPGGLDTVTDSGDGGFRHGGLL